MTDLKKLQKEIYQNKVNKGFNRILLNIWRSCRGI